MNQNLKNYAIFSGLAIQMGVTIYAASIFGEWLDNKYHTAPAFKAAGVLLAVALSIYIILQQLKRINKQDSK